MQGAEAIVFGRVRRSAEVRGGRAAEDPRCGRFFELVLDPSKLPSDAALFRLANKPDTILTREDLGKALTRGDKPAAAVKFRKLENYGHRRPPAPHT